MNTKRGLILVGLYSIIQIIAALQISPNLSLLQQCVKDPKLPWVDLCNRFAQPLCNIVHCLIALGDDPDRLGDGLGRDRVVARHHDHLDARRSALAH